MAQSATQAQRVAALAARLAPTAQAANSLSVAVDGTKPTVDIPITVLILG